MIEITANKMKLILGAMKISKSIQVSVDDINSLISGELEEDEIQDLLEITADEFRYVKIQKLPVNGVSVVVSAELTARGRQYLREAAE